MGTSQSTSFAILPDKHTTSEINTLYPKDGAIVFDTTENTLKVYKSGNWVALITNSTNPNGWGNYVDGQTSPATQTFDTTPSKIQIDSLGATTNEEYLPTEIRGSGSLWDSTNDKITPIQIGDSYTLRIDFTVTSKVTSPTLLDLVLDIGSDATPTIPIVSRTISLPKTPPFDISVGFPIFCLNTFKTNGGQLFLSTDTGSIEISKRLIFISRISDGTL